MSYKPPMRVIRLQYTFLRLLFVFLLTGICSANHSAIAQEADSGYLSESYDFTDGSQPLSQQVNSPPQALEPPEPEPESSGWGLQIDASGGFSDNVAQFEGSPEGSFLQSSQNIEYAAQLREGVRVRLQGGGYFRQFIDSDINDKFRMAVYNGEAEITALLHPQWDLGFQIEGESFLGRELDFTNNLGLGRDSRYFSLGGSTFLRHYRTVDMFEVRLTREMLNGLTTTIDERGNLFNNSVNTTTTQAKYARQFSDNWAMELSYSFAYKEYLNRRARLSNGTIDPNFQTDFLIENEHRFVARSFIHQLQLDLGIEYVEDQIFSAETRYSMIAEASFLFSIFERLNLRPFFQWSPTYYLNFIGDIINNPAATELREDNITTYGIEAELNLGLINPIVTYQNNQLQSNYQILNFSEESIAAGLRLSF